MRESSPAKNTVELECPRRDEPDGAEKMAARVEAHRRWIDDDADVEPACRGID